MAKTLAVTAVSTRALLLAGWLMPSWLLFLVTIVPWWAGSKATLAGFWRKVADQGVFNHYTDFSKGIIDSGNFVFFVAMTAVFLFLTVKVLESRRWK